MVAVDMSIIKSLKSPGLILIGVAIGVLITYYLVAKERGSVLKAVDAGGAGFSVGLKFGDPLDCVISEASGSAVCDGSAPGTALRDVWRQLGEAKRGQSENLERAEKAERALQEAGRRIANMRADIERCTSKSQALKNFLMLNEGARGRNNSYLTSPGNTITAFNGHISVVYKRLNDAGRGVILSSNLWTGEIDLGFGTFHRAILREPGIEGEVEISAILAPAQFSNDTPIHLTIRPIGANSP
jgi:hypothetical protein